MKIVPIILQVCVCAKIYKTMLCLKKVMFLAGQCYFCADGCNFLQRTRLTQETEGTYTHDQLARMESLSDATTVTRNKLESDSGLCQLNRT